MIDIAISQTEIVVTEVSAQAITVEIPTNETLVTVTATPEPSLEMTVAEPVTVEVTNSPDSTVVEVSQTPVTVEVQLVGAQGPQGPTAPTYVHTQASPASTWTIAHNLGFKPSIQLFDSGGQEIEGEILNVSSTLSYAYFITEVAGSARCL